MMYAGVFKNTGSPEHDPNMVGGPPVLPGSISAVLLHVFCERPTLVTIGPHDDRRIYLLF